MLKVFDLPIYSCRYATKNWEVLHRWNPERSGVNGVRDVPRNIVVNVSSVLIVFEWVVLESRSNRVLNGSAFMSSEIGFR